MQTMVALSCAAAALSGFFAMVTVRQHLDSRAQRNNAKAAIASDILARDGRAAEPALCGILRQASHASAPLWLRRFASLRLWGVGMADIRRMLARAGLAETAASEGARIARVWCSFAGALGGALAGAVFSPELSALLAVVGAGGGFCWIPLGLKRRAAERMADMERHLSEMAEVVVLGLRSGLSFERSFRLYPKYFDTGLGRSMARVAGQWEVGLVAREEALKSLEREYDSVLLSRIVGSMVRSLRFGTSVADSLESAALEAREVHRARMEERVAKVAVKMMLPVGTLILPAMLLLVLGPVLLELVQGF